VTTVDAAVGPAGDRRPVGDGGPEIAALVASRVLDVPDFPKAGILFKDLSPLFSDGAAFAAVTDSLVAHYRPMSMGAGVVEGGRGAGDLGFDVVAGIEARGFMLAAAVAYASGVGVVAIRKAGKLPRATIAASYDLEYDKAAIEIHADAFTPGQRVLVVDDVLATGGTAEAAVDLVSRGGGVIAGFTVLLELAFLGGRKRLEAQLGGLPVHALLTV